MHKFGWGCPFNTDGDMGKLGWGTLLTNTGGHIDKCGWEALLTQVVTLTSLAGALF